MFLCTSHYYPSHKMPYIIPVGSDSTVQVQQPLRSLSDIVLREILVQFTSNQACTAVKHQTICDVPEELHPDLNHEGGSVRNAEKERERERTHSLNLKDCMTTRSSEAGNTSDT